jgi:hypothetical protein
VGTENKKYIEGMRQLRHSNAAGTHDNRPNRIRTRQAELEAALEDEEYDDE